MTTPEISLDPMTEAEFAAWLLPTVRDLAEQHVKSGRWAEKDALVFAKAEFLTLLPDGVRSSEQHLYTVRARGDGAGAGLGVGSLWIGMRLKAGKSEAFIYDVVIAEAYRGLGYGRAAMLAAVQKSRELGAASIGLHVFGHNTVARGLYESLGFAVTNVNMSFSLEDGAAD